MDFTKWILYLEMEEVRNTKQDYALARIAAEVRRSYAAKPNSVRDEDLLMKFEKVKKKERTKEEATATSKRYVFGCLGLKKDGTS